MEEQLGDLIKIDKKIIEIATVTPYSYSEVKDIVMGLTEHVLEFSQAGHLNPNIVVSDLFKTR